MTRKIRMTVCFEYEAEPKNYGLGAYCTDAELLEAIEKVDEPFEIIPYLSEEEVEMSVEVVKEGAP
ncbi:MAG: hypothetical protein GY871_04305 [Actinomycetales bacterium]|nr:hypothetical protein [Actinomycetales bacterium]